MLEVRLAAAHIDPVRVIEGDDPDSLLVEADQNMEDRPVFTDGAQVVLFLNVNADRKTSSAVGLIQGKFDLSVGIVERERYDVGRFIARPERIVAGY